MSKPTSRTKTVRHLRAAWGWSQPVLAGRLGVSPATVSLWERGRVVPSPANRERLGECFGVPATTIAFGPDGARG